LYFRVRSERCERQLHPQRTASRMVQHMLHDVLPTTPIPIQLHLLGLRCEILTTFMVVDTDETPITTPASSPCCSINSKSAQKTTTSQDLSQTTRMKSSRLISSVRMSSSCESGKSGIVTARSADSASSQISTRSQAEQATFESCRTADVGVRG